MQYLYKARSCSTGRREVSGGRIEDSGGRPRPPPTTVGRTLAMVIIATVTANLHSNHAL